MFVAAMELFVFLCETSLYTLLAGGRWFQLLDDPRGGGARGLVQKRSPINIGK